MSSLKDARIARTDSALRAALLTLLEQKPFEQITIREIAAEAGVHYTTFFRHHATKDSLLDHLAASQINTLVKLSVLVLDEADSQSAFVTLCTYVESHRSLWSVLLTGGAAGAMRDELLRLAREVAPDFAPRTSWLPVDLAVSCMVNVIFETLAWWLKQPVDAHSPAQVAQYLHSLVLSVPMQAETPDSSARPTSFSRTARPKRG